MTQLLFILSNPPGSSVYAQEAFDAALAGSAFSNIAMLFVAAGCLQLIEPRLETAAHQRKDFQRGYLALPDYDIQDIFCCAQSYKDHHLQTASLVVQPALLSQPEISALIERADSVLSF